RGAADSCRKTELSTCASRAGLSIVCRLDQTTTVRICHGEADTDPFRFWSASLFEVRHRKNGT
ncbi:MAG TPA: hypothetical protein VIK50_13220, partial [Gemmatimonadaceae bacterium]